MRAPPPYKGGRNSNPRLCLSREGGRISRCRTQSGSPKQLDRKTATPVRASSVAWLALGNTRS